MGLIRRAQAGPGTRKGAGACAGKGADGEGKLPVALPPLVPAPLGPPPAYGVNPTPPPWNALGASWGGAACAGRGGIHPPGAATGAGAMYFAPPYVVLPALPAPLGGAHACPLGGAPLLEYPPPPAGGDHGTWLGGVHAGSRWRGGGGGRG